MKHEQHANIFMTGPNAPTYGEIQAPYMEACNVEVRIEGLDVEYRVHEDDGWHGCLLKGELWERNIVPIKENQGIYIPKNICSYIFEVLVRHYVCCVHDWTMFHHVFCKNLYSSSMFLLRPHWKGNFHRYGFFHNPGWQVEFTDKIPASAKKRLEKCNIELAKLVQTWQNGASDIRSEAMQTMLYNTSFC